MISSNFILLTRYSAANPASAKLATAANAGWPVQVDSAGASAHLHDDTTTWRVANGAIGKLFFLTRPVIAGTEQPLTNIVFGNTDVNPVLVSDPVDGVEVLELEAEGGDTDADGLATYLKTASTGAIDGTTAVNTPLTLVAGRWAVLTDVATQPRCGKLVKQLTPYTASNIRIGIEVCEPVFDKLV